MFFACFMFNVGSSLWRHLDSLADRVVTVISADLAHTHDSHGPYGYSNASQPFDEVCKSL